MDVVSRNIMNIFIAAWLYIIMQIHHAWTFIMYKSP